MKRILSLSLLLSTSVHLQASTPTESRSASPVLQLTESTLQAAIRAELSKRDLKGNIAQATQLGLASAEQIAQNSLGGSTGADLAKLALALGATIANPSLANILTTAQLTSQEIAELAPLFTTVEGRAKLEASCFSCLKGQSADGAQATLAQATAPTQDATVSPTRGARAKTRGGNKKVTITCTAAQASMLGDLVKAVHELSKPRELTLEQQELLRRTLRSHLPAEDTQLSLV